MDKLLQIHKMIVAILKNDTQFYIFVPKIIRIMYKYIFGPVPSRRLGMSLGVDLVPRKVCSLDCVYCEVGATTKLSLERMEYVPFEQIRHELIHFFENNPDPDYITFSGSGEPTLNSRFGDVLQFIKTLKPQIPVAVLTNGTLLHLRQVRNEMTPADVVLPSLDAGTKAVFDAINRPAENLNFENYLQGLIDFRQEFLGQIWLEVFILPGYNDHKSELLAIKDIILRIKPDQVQINTLDRPGVLPGLQKASSGQLRHIVDLWGLENVTITAAAPQRKTIKSYRSDTETAILETIARRPCTLDDLANMVGLHISEVNKYLDVLEMEGKIIRKEEDRGVFYGAVSE